MLPTMLRELLRSTLYSSKRPFSSKATRDSSFSTLTMSLLPVFRDERPKIFLTLSIIKLKKLIGHRLKLAIHAAALILKPKVIVVLLSAGESAAVEPAQVRVAGALQKAVERNYAGGEALPAPQHGPLARTLAAALCLECRPPVRRRVTRLNSPFVPWHFVTRRHPLRLGRRDCLPRRDKSLI